MYVQAKETQLIDDNKLALRLEELAVRLQTARYGASDTARLLSECSEQLGATPYRLNATKVQLKTAKTVLNEKDCGKGGSAGGKLTEDRSDFVPKIAICSIACLKLEEMRSRQQIQETMINNCSIRLEQARNGELTAAVAAIECLHKRDRLQQLLKECADEEKLNEVKKQGCNCARESATSKNDIEAFRAAEPIKEGTMDQKEITDGFNSKNKTVISCTQQLTEARSNLTIRESMLENCSRDLKQERADRLAASETAVKCARELDGVRDRLGAKTTAIALAKCESQLKQSNLALSNAMNQCPRVSENKPEAPRAGHSDGECQSTKFKVELTRCNEELESTGETARWKTLQLDKCAENLVQTRREVQALTTLLKKTNSNHETVVKTLELSHREELKNLRFRHRQELEQAKAYCYDVDLLLDLMTKSLAFIFVIAPVYFWLMFLILLVGYILYLTMGRYWPRYQNFVGVRDRQVLYRVNFRSPRHR